VSSAGDGVVVGLGGKARDGGRLLVRVAQTEEQRNRSLGLDEREVGRIRMGAPHAVTDVWRSDAIAVEAAMDVQDWPRCAGMEGLAVLGRMEAVR